MGVCTSKPQHGGEAHCRDMAPAKQPPLDGAKAATPDSKSQHTADRALSRRSDTVSEYCDPNSALQQAHAMLSECQAQPASSCPTLPSGANGSAAPAVASVSAKTNAFSAEGIPSISATHGSAAASSDAAGSSSIAGSSSAGGHSSASSSHVDAAPASPVKDAATDAAATGSQPQTHCFADDCISPTSDLSPKPQKPQRPLRVCSSPPAEGPATPEQVAHIPGVVLPGDLAVLAAADLQGQPYNVYQRGPPPPPCDSARLQAMQWFGPIDAPNQAALSVEHVLDLLCQVFHVENVLLALFGDHRIYIRNSRGFQRGDFPWRWSFCAWSMLPPEPEILLIEDTKKDARFADNEVANTLGVRFYCGAPLLGSSGQRLGTLCFVDSKPRDFNAEQLLILANLSEVVVRELERELLDRERRARAETFMSRALECFDSGVAFVDTSQPGWRALHCSSTFTKATGITTAAARAAPLWQLLRGPGGLAPGGDALWEDACGVMASHRREFMLAGLTVTGSPDLGTFSLRFRPAGRDALDEHTLPIGIPAQVPSDPHSAAAGQFYFAILATRSLQSSTSASHASSRASSADLDTLLAPSLRQASAVLQPHTTPFDGLELGPLVGRGSFGRVYRGFWDGRSVAVKIAGPLGAGKTSYPEVCKSMEALTSGRLHHPNVVRTFRHCTILAHETTSGMATVSEDATAEGAPAAAPDAAAAAAFNAASSGGSGSSGGSNDGSAIIASSGSGDAGSGGNRVANSRGGGSGGGGSRKPRRPPPPVFNPFAAANAAKADAASAPCSRKPSFQSPFSAANQAKVATSAPGSKPSTPDSKQPPNGLAAFAAARAAALAIRDDSARSSLDKSGDGSRDATAQRLQAAAERMAAEQVLAAAAAATSGKSAGSSGSSQLSAASNSGDVETWMLLEYCDMGTLQGGIDKGWFRSRLATKDGPPNLPVILAAAADICAGMAYLHSRGIVHGDLAGGNVLLCSTAEVGHGFTAKIADFGLARLIALRDRICTDTYGTVTHMPPELLSGGDLSQAVDVYSFGVLLWEMYNGTRAWAGLAAAQVIMAVTMKGRKPVFPDSTPPEFAVLANACMLADPAARPTFAELESAIARLRLVHM